MIAELLSPPISYFSFGALGGLLYVLRQHMNDYEVKRVEYLARPVFGAVVATILTVSLGLPNHLTSLFAGYFGIDAWDTIAAKVESAGLARLSFERKPKAPKK